MVRADASPKKTQISDRSYLGKLIESATAFFKTLKVYPKKSDLINIFDKSVQKVRNKRRLALQSLIVL
jgi:hypothetical protein